MLGADYPADRFPVPDRTDGPTTVPVGLGRPLATGEQVYATIAKQIRGVVVHSRRVVRVGACSSAPTDAEVRAAVKASAAQAAKILSKLSRKALRRAKRFRLPVTYSEPGAYRLRVIARGRTIATGTRARRAPGKANVTLKLSAKGRAILKRTRRVTLEARFTPARAGATAQRARTRVRLR